MGRRVFFSFHFDRDFWRVSIVRNAWSLAGTRDANTIVDKAEWEAVKRKGDTAIENWINSQMNGASVLAVLIGAETYTRPWVQYEIRKAHRDGRGIIGVHLAGIKNEKSVVDARGPNPIELANLKDANGRAATYRTFSWIQDDGRTNLPNWVEAAAKAAGR